ncbi:acetyl-CoA-benzylalcohol acetyltransferase-like [Lycium barbarum]|uniref:acetyl-CoA-benzylalcohol acetyltransferase-like n=1 Tax=Lycium barbarum TaxID=112863 RepID=UPI00293F66A7|nr:acetyl-CoA-benzylalcohol acetyltransferase-like [Lycium barbarum]
MPEFYGRLVTSRWIRFADEPIKANYTLVRELYANAAEADITNRAIVKLVASLPSGPCGEGTSTAPSGPGGPTLASVVEELKHIKEKQGKMERRQKKAREHAKKQSKFLNNMMSILRSVCGAQHGEKSFGNLVIEAPAKFVPGENNMELKTFVTLIRDTVKQTISACDKTSPDDVVAAVANLYNGSFISPEWGGSDEVDMYTSSSLCRFPIQEADFGWGKPCLMHFGSRHNQCCWLYDAKCGNGICVQVDLKEANVQLFECDDDIKAFFEF